MASTKPTILLIPGSFSHAFMYDNVAAEIKKQGYPFEIANLPSSDRKPPASAATMTEDAELFASMLSKLCHDESKDVVVVGHSYGGIVATETVKGFTEPRDGKGGKVVGIVYLTCLVPKVGESLMSMSEGQVALDFIKMDGEFMYHDPAELSAKVNFSDLPPEEGVSWVKQFGYHSAPSFAGQSTYAGYEDVKDVAFILCTRDKTLQPDFQRKMIENINSGRTGKGKGECTVYEFAGDHCPLAGQPENTAKKIVQAVEGLA